MKGIIQLINTLKFRQQLLLMIVLPVVGLIYYASSNVIEKTSEFREIKKVNALTILCEKLSVLSHEIQEERSYYSIFHATGGAIPEYTDSLRNRFISVDSTISETKAHIKEINLEDYSPKFNERIKEIDIQMDTIKSLRPNVDFFLGGDKTPLLSAYTDLQTTVLEIITEISDLSTNVELSTLTASYVNLLKSKEACGKEGLIGLNSIMGRKFQQSDYEGFLGRINDQEVYAEIFKGYSNDKINLAYNEFTKSSNYASIAVMRDTMKSRKFSNEGLGVNPRAWNDSITVKLGQIKDIEIILKFDLIVI